jgi:predicted GNAT family acetyltransferase
VELRRYTDVDAFLAAAGPFLVAREAEHNLIFGVSSSLRESPEAYGQPYLGVVSEGDRVVAAALQTPPFRLILSEVDDPAAIDLLVTDLLDRDLPGMLGPVEVMDAFMKAWNARGGRPARRVLAERAFRLTEVVPPRPVAGAARVAGPADRDLVTAWVIAFMREALEDEDDERVAADVDRWLAGKGRTIHLWEDGEPMSLSGVGGNTPNGIRIGPVYTPPDRRGRGYASALVAAVSQAQLDAGKQFCFLFTDLANPTSNKIYQAIGYEPVRDFEIWVLDGD